MPTYSIASGSYDGRARIYDIRMGRTSEDVFAHPVTSVRCSADGNVLLASTLDSRVRMLDRADGKLLKAFGSENRDGGPAVYRNSELRVRSVFAKADAVVLSGSEADKEDKMSEASVFAWDVLTGEVIATVSAGKGVRVVSCVAWNEKGGCWAGGCSDGMAFPGLGPILEGFGTDYCLNRVRQGISVSSCRMPTGQAMENSPTCLESLLPS